MLNSPNGYFEIATTEGSGLADAKMNDLVVFTSNPSQRILLGCGENTVSSVCIAPDGVKFNTAMNMTRLSVSNLIADALDVKNVTSLASSMNVQSFNGPMNFSANNRATFNIKNPSSATGAFQIFAGNNEAMRVAANGFVGIGTSYPTSALDVSGSLSINGVSVMSPNRSMTNVASLSVLGSTSLGSGDLTIDATAKSLILSPLYKSNFGGDLTVQGVVSLNSMVSVGGNIFSVANSNLVVRDQSVGIMTYTPRSALDVTGSIMSSAGTLGPILNIIPPTEFSDVPHNSFFKLDGSIESGNPCASNNYFDGISLLGADYSEDSASWNRIRFIFRGVLMGNVALNPYSTMNVFKFESGTYKSVTSPNFKIANLGPDKGFRYFITPWVTYSPNTKHYALMHVANDATSSFRIGAVHVQFAS